MKCYLNNDSKQLPHVQAKVDRMKPTHDDLITLLLTGIWGKGMQGSVQIIRGEWWLRVCVCVWMRWCGDRDGSPSAYTLTACATATNFFFFAFQSHIVLKHRQFWIMQHSVSIWRFWEAGKTWQTAKRKRQSKFLGQQGKPEYVMTTGKTETKNDWSRQRKWWTG